MKIKIFVVVVIIQLVSSALVVSGIEEDSGTGFILDNPLGFIEWDLTFDSNFYDDGYCIQQTCDGGYICIGRGYGWDVVLMKISAMGDIEWVKHYDKNSWDFGYYVLQTDDDGYILLASTKETFEYAKSTYSYEVIGKMWGKIYESM